MQRELPPLEPINLERHDLLSMSDDDFLYFINKSAANKQRSGKDFFVITGPVTLNYNNKQHKFIGMESYQLEVIVPNLDKPEYYFRTFEASKCPKLYGLNAEVTKKLFGTGPQALFCDYLRQEKSSPFWVELIAERERMSMQKKYGGCDMNFGAW